MRVQDADGWGLKLEALKLIQTFVQFFSRLIGPHLPPIMAQAWQLFVASLPVYQDLVINSTPDLDAEQAGAAWHPFARLQHDCNTEHVTQPFGMFSSPTA